MLKQKLNIWNFLNSFKFYSSKSTPHKKSYAFLRIKKIWQLLPLECCNITRLGVIFCTVQIWWYILASSSETFPRSFWVPPRTDCASAARDSMILLIVSTCINLACRTEARWSSCGCTDKRVWCRRYVTILYSEDFDAQAPNNFKVSAPEVFKLRLRPISKIRRR